MREHIATVGFTLHQVAQLVPNRKGTDHVHPATILRRVARGEFPKPDLEFGDGTKIWHGSTLRVAKILPPEVA